jgi:hypothetical protein
MSIDGFIGSAATRRLAVSSNADPRLGTAASSTRARRSSPPATPKMLVSCSAESPISCVGNLVVRRLLLAPAHTSIWSASAVICPIAVSAA